VTATEVLAFLKVTRITLGPRVANAALGQYQLQWEAVIEAVREAASAEFVSNVEWNLAIEIDGEKYIAYTSIEAGRALVRGLREVK